VHIVRADAMHLERALGKIDADLDNLHVHGPLNVIRLRRSIDGTSMPRAGTLTHPAGIPVWVHPIELTHILCSPRCSDLACFLSGLCRADNVVGRRTPDPRAAVEYRALRPPDAKVATHQTGAVLR
jgi:hypothetical protein